MPIAVIRFETAIAECLPCVALQPLGFSGRPSPCTSQSRKEVLVDEGDNGFFTSVAAVRRRFGAPKETPVKWVVRQLIVVSLACCGAALSNAQTSTSTLAQPSTANTPIKHVIMIIQENRSTDNLFGADTTLAQNGGHLATSGSCHGTDVP